MNDSSIYSTKIFTERPLLMDRFSVVRVLGEGAAGAVYLVEDRQRNNNRVALKVLVNKEAFDQHTCQRFLSEWEISSRLRHPNLVEAYELIKLNDAVAFTMEYVEGGDFKQFLGRSNIDWATLDRLFIQLLDALEYLHSHALYHRDIKLENIMLSSTNQVKLSDLGLMKLTSVHLPADAQKLTQTGILLGTAQYMPPEYIVSSQYNHCSDLYAVGIVLYEIISGERWLGHLRGNEVITHLINTHFTFPEITSVTIPEKYSYILKNCLHSKPQKRFQSAAEVRECFNKHIQDPFWHKPRLDTKIQTPTPMQKTPPTRSQATATIQQPSCSIFYALGGLFLLLTSMGLASAAYVWQTRSIELAAGTYRGILQEDKSGKSFNIQLQVGPVGAVVNSNSKLCQSGFISFANGTLSCGQSNFWVVRSKADKKERLKLLSWLGTQASIEVKKIN